MSRTDKDRPYWVVNAEAGVINHDHRNGVCIIEEPHSSWADWHHHWRRCKKRVTVEWTCTKADPNYDRMGRRTCWTVTHTGDPELSRSKDWEAYVASIRWRSTQCVGHSKVEVDESIPCACDDRPPVPTCTIAWDYSQGGSRYYRRPPKWYRDHVYNNVERRREREELDDAARLFNAYGWLGLDYDGFDFHSRQARSGAKYAWW